MKTLIVTDTIRESFDDAGRKINSLETVARDLSGLPVVRESYTYEMTRYTGKTKRDCMVQLEYDCLMFMQPIGTMDIRWV